jgi:hypothetical protein
MWKNKPVNPFNPKSSSNTILYLSTTFAFGSHSSTALPEQQNMGHSMAKTTNGIGYLRP